MTTATLDTVLRHLHRLVGVPADRTPDSDLLGRFVQARDEAAFAELVRRHGPMVRSVCHSVLRHRHDAEDAFQATFLVLARKADTIRKRSSLGAWLYEVAYHLALRARAGAARQRGLGPWETAMPAADPLLDMTLRELQLALHDELQQLPEKYRTPLVLCYLEGQTQDVAARQLGLCKGALRGRLNRGRERLRRRLADRGLALSAGGVVAALAARSAAGAVSAGLAEAVSRTAAAFAADPSGAAALGSPPVGSLAQGATRATAPPKAQLAPL